MTEHFVLMSAKVSVQPDGSHCKKNSLHTRRHDGVGPRQVGQVDHLLVLLVAPAALLLVSARGSRIGCLNDLRPEDIKFRLFCDNFRYFLVFPGIFRYFQVCSGMNTNDLHT